MVEIFGMGCITVLIIVVYVVWAIYRHFNHSNGDAERYLYGDQPTDNNDEEQYD